MFILLDKCFINIYFTAYYKQGSTDRVVKVSASQPGGRGLELHSVTTMIPYMTLVLVGKRKRTRE